jgi:hypothetical protein
MLHKILLELDNKFDIEVEDYFTLSTNDRAEITKYVLDHWVPEINRNPLFANQLHRAFLIKLDEAERDQEYEKCDIYSRILITLEDLTF